MPHVSMDKGRTHLTFIGGGTMACAILDGLADSDFVALESDQETKYSVSITARRKERAEQLLQRYPEAYVTDNNDDENLWNFDQGCEPAAHIILICTKPQSTYQVCESIRLAHQKVSASCDLPTVVTMCPGITLASLEGWLTPQNSSRPFTVVRTMPNTPVSIRQGATALVASRHATSAEINSVITLFHVFSPCVEVLPEESLLNVAAAVSGSGPAYIFQFYKSLVAAGVHWGLPESLTHSLVTQTGVGTSMLASSQSGVTLSSMIRDVCVPGGSTEKGIKSLVEAGLQTAVTNAVSISLEANLGMKGRKEHPELSVSSKTS